MVIKTLDPDGSPPPVSIEKDPSPDSTRFNLIQSGSIWFDAGGKRVIGGRGGEGKEGERDISVQFEMRCWSDSVVHVTTYSVRVVDGVGRVRELVGIEGDLAPIPTSQRT